jgi:hypothetical protein
MPTALYSNRRRRTCTDVAVQICGGISGIAGALKLCGDYTRRMQAGETF